MPTYKDIFNLNLKYIEYLLAKTSLTHDYIHNINVTGSEIEQEVRLLLRNLLPQRFHVTHGYIISAADQLKEPLVSPQVDVIIVDTLVPHSIFIIDQHSGMEVVPIEAVTGVFEVKRTLNRKSLLNQDGAFKHIRDICETVGIRKDNGGMFLPGGIEINPFIRTLPQEYFSLDETEIAKLSHNQPQGYYSNPLIGIIGVDHEAHIGEKLETWMEKKQVDFGLLDLLFSINGYLACTAKLMPTNEMVPYIYTYREHAEQYPDFVTYMDTLHSRSEIVAKALGFIVGYIASTGGRIFDINNYFFNESLLGSS